MNVLGCVHMATMGQSSQYGEEWPLATVITTFVSTVYSFFKSILSVYTQDNFQRLNVGLGGQENQLLCIFFFHPHGCNYYQPVATELLIKNGLN